MTENTHKWHFRKMHGLGNDFVVVDARAVDFDMSPERAMRIADRRRGIGCDQLIVLRRSTAADVYMEIWNADGSCVSACGNATRCIGMLILDETGKASATIETDAGLLSATQSPYGISVNMGPARTLWHEIPLAREMATDSGTFTLGTLKAPGFVNMGNPHAVFFVDDAESVAIEEAGPYVETHGLFPERANVSFATVTGDTIRLRVWERGAGITEACGSAACAAVVAATRKRLLDHKATVKLDGGDLQVEWLENGTVQMAGPATLIYTGECDL